ncbi:MAG: hypothetical protein B5M54_00785 [Candidatus Aminicenantes bacterium 4484_214]|nr:MAG: hypothetical protein B5M54_00785 [Candidatus Aminicenantes bacterium 4484_214]RLE11008.1 MAG: hypothetical protein DRJ06_00150 [Candidatus Aminicenantes bacterium]
MKSILWQREFALGGILGIFILLTVGNLILAQTEQQSEIKKAIIYQDMYPLVSESDLYCSFLIWEETLPQLKIIGAEREYERVLFNNDDIVYLNQGKKEGLQPGQLFLILEFEREIGNYGYLVHKRGRARVIHLSDHGATARIEKACGQITLGNYLVPFEEKEGFAGQDLGFNIPPYKTEGPKGEIIYLTIDFNQIGRGHWALINLGKSEGVKVGDQLIVYREPVKEAPLQVIGNVLVIDAQEHTSTVKVLSCRDALRIGDLIQFRPQPGK